MGSSGSGGGFACRVRGDTHEATEEPDRFRPPRGEVGGVMERRRLFPWLKFNPPSRLEKDAGLFVFSAVCLEFYKKSGGGGGGSFQTISHMFSQQIQIRSKDSHSAFLFLFFFSSFFNRQVSQHNGANLLASPQVLYRWFNYLPQFMGR